MSKSVQWNPNPGAGYSSLWREGDIFTLPGASPEDGDITYTYSISPSEITVDPGDIIQFEATLVGSNGVTMNVTRDTELTLPPGWIRIGLSRIQVPSNWPAGQQAVIGGVLGGEYSDQMEVTVTGDSPEPNPGDPTEFGEYDENVYWEITPVASARPDWPDVDAYYAGYNPLDPETPVGSIVPHNIPPELQLDNFGVFIYKDNSGLMFGMLGSSSTFATTGMAYKLEDFELELHSDLPHFVGPDVAAMGVRYLGSPEDLSIDYTSGPFKLYPSIAPRRRPRDSGFNNSWRVTTKERFIQVSYDPYESTTLWIRSTQPYVLLVGELYTIYNADKSRYDLDIMDFSPDQGEQKLIWFQVRREDETVGDPIVVTVVLFNIGEEGTATVNGIPIDTLNVYIPENKTSVLSKVFNPSDEYYDFFNTLTDSVELEITYAPA